MKYFTSEKSKQTDVRNRRGIAAGTFLSAALLSGCVSTPPEVVDGKLSADTSDLFTSSFYRALQEDGFGLRSVIRESAEQERADYWTAEPTIQKRVEYAELYIGKHCLLSNVKINFTTDHFRVTDISSYEVSVMTEDEATHDFVPSETVAPFKVANAESLIKKTHNDNPCEAYSFDIVDAQ